MPPKKREKENEPPNKSSKSENNNGDHEQFLQAFEKPTQIYRYLRTRHMIKPIFLLRTLLYMKHRMSRNHKRRKSFKVDSMLQTITNRLQPQQPITGFLTLTFLGFYNKSSQGQEDPVKVETLLLKVCHKKRKDVSCPVLTVSLGTSYVPLNPSEEFPPPKAPTVSVPTECFSLSGQLVKSYHLLLRVSTMSSNISALTAIHDDSKEPATKKRKLSKSSEDDKPVQFGTEVIIYDKQNRCLLTDGEYEFLLEKLDGTATKINNSLSTWEDISFEREIQEQHIESFQDMTNGPTLKIRLQWSREQVTPIIDRPPPIIPICNSELVKENNNKTGMEVAKQLDGPSVVYHFLYNGNTKQQTETAPDLQCAWCSIDCKTLYSLLKHLKLCHPRFNVTYVGGIRIDISVNDGYDGSSWRQSGGPIRGTGPAKRPTVSHIIVCRPKRSPPHLSEFMDTQEAESQRPYITGHNRLYHHTTTCLPIYPKEMEIDSEDETDPRWLQKKTMMMIDEFTDVNEGEKELMKMWNLHVMKHGFVGDCQIPLACAMFLQEKGKELLKKNLYRNFVLHMSTLFDFGLVSPVTVFTTMQKLQEIIQTDEEINKILQQSWATQREHWNPLEQAPKIDSSSSPTGQQQDNSGQSRRKPTEERGKRRRGRRLSSGKPDLRSKDAAKETSNKKSAP